MNDTERDLLKEYLFGGDRAPSPDIRANAALRRHRPLLSGDHHDDEIGVLLDGEGGLPAEARGRHCKYCGEEIAVLPDFGEDMEPGSVQEYRHKASRTVHCVVAWQDGIRAAFAEETAAPLLEAGVPVQRRVREEAGRWRQGLGRAGAPGA